MRHLHLGNLSYLEETESRMAGGGAAMLVEPIPDPEQVLCHHSNKSGHPEGLRLARQHNESTFKRGNTELGGAGEKIWYLVQRVGRGAAILVEPRSDSERVLWHHSNEPKPSEGLRLARHHNENTFKRGKTEVGGAGEKSWYFVQRVTTHINTDCYQQGAPRSQEGGYHRTTVFNSTILPTPSFNRSEEGDFSQECNFGHGFVFRTEVLRWTNLLAQKQQRYHTTGNTTELSTSWTAI